jgi:hypothetical protein
LDEQKGRHHLDNVGTNDMKMYKWTLKKKKRRVWAEYFWYSTGSQRYSLVNTEITFGFHERPKISLLDKQPIVHHERLYSMS